MWHASACQRVFVTGICHWHTIRDATQPPTPPPLAHSPEHVLTCLILLLTSAHKRGFILWVAILWLNWTSYKETQRPRAVIVEKESLAVAATSSLVPKNHSIPQHVCIRMSRTCLSSAPYSRRLKVRRGQKRRGYKPWGGNVCYRVFVHPGQGEIK